MGYRTRFELDLTNTQPEDKLDLRAILGTLRETNEEAEYALTEDGETENESKWYDHEKDLRAFSLDHPTVLFELSGMGEEQPDLWKKYFLNGRVQKAPAKISYDAFNPNALR